MCAVFFSFLVHISHLTCLVSYYSFWSLNRVCWHFFELVEVELVAEFMVGKLVRKNCAAKSRVETKNLVKSKQEKWNETKHVGCDFHVFYLKSYKTHIRWTAVVVTKGGGSGYLVCSAGNITGICGREILLVFAGGNYYRYFRR